MQAAPLAWSLLLAFTAICSDAQACSVAPSYRVPTTLQLVEQADVIVLARIIDGGPSKFESFALQKGGAAHFVPLSTLKGDLLGQSIKFTDASLELPSASLRVTSSDPRNLVDANPDVFSGSCNRVVFKNNMIVVAFLKRDGNALVPFAPAFSRALEDVPATDSLWVKAVRMYVTIAAKPKSLRRQEMRRQRNSLQFELDDPDGRLLALELDRSLHNPER